MTAKLEIVPGYGGKLIGFNKETWVYWEPNLISNTMFNQIITEENRKTYDIDREYLGKIASFFSREKFNLPGMTCIFCGAMFYYINDDDDNFFKCWDCQLNNV